MGQRHQPLLSQRRIEGIHIADRKQLVAMTVLDIRENDVANPVLRIVPQTEFQEIRAGGAGRKKAAGADAAFDQLDPAAQLDILAKLYAKDLGADPKFPDSVDAIKTKPEKVAAKNEFLVREIHEHIAVDESDLAALGQLRATNLQQALLTGTQIDPQRVFLVANDKAKNQDGRVRLELSLR